MYEQHSKKWDKKVLKTVLPHQSSKTYGPVKACVYCRVIDDLRDEHIIPYSLGGRWTLLSSSCSTCEKITSAFERVCSRPILGALRIFYDLPTRRPKRRPDQLLLKVKYNSADRGWTEVPVDHEDYPFLVLFPHYELPSKIRKLKKGETLDSSTDKFWIRGAAKSPQGFKAHLEVLTRKLNVREIMPDAKFYTHEFCLMLAKIAHAFTVGEFGLDSFESFLVGNILNKDTSNIANFVGGLPSAEPVSKALHEISFDSEIANNSITVVVRIRLFACLGAPTYYVIVGNKT